VRDGVTPTTWDRKVSQWHDYLDPLRLFAVLEGLPFEPNDAQHAVCAAPAGKRAGAG